MYFGRCLVTGGTGWLGPYVVAALEASGNEVVACDRRLQFTGPFDAVVHASPGNLDEVMVRAVEGRHVLLSSGAVVHKPDAYLDGYATAKRQAEDAARAYPNVLTARLYSVLGPGIPLNAHYAASHFLRQAVAGGPVVVRDGAIRSYLHPADVASALLTILAYGDGEPYDVGGEVAIEVAELGKQIAIAAGVACHLAQPEFPKDIYLPNLTRLHRLGWRQTIGLDAMIEQTLASLKAPA